MRRGWTWSRARTYDDHPRAVNGTISQEDHPTTTRAMISDPKLPFPSEPATVEPLATPIPQPNGGNEIATPPQSLPRSRSTGRIWLRRVGVLFFVFVCATIGVMLMILPWRPEWSDNPLLLPYPVFRGIVSTGFFRGLVTGLGLLNVWIGFWEALRYSED